MDDPASRPLRFGAVAPITRGMPAWRDQVRRLADHGFSTVLMPDVPSWQPAPAPALAVAATLADVRVGTWVYASPVRPPWTTAWEAHSLTELTEGRFEMGIGVGRPGIEDHLRDLGLPASPVGARLDEVRRVVEVLRELDGNAHRTPVVLAAGGPRSVALAVEVADVVTLAMPHVESRDATAARLRRLDDARHLERALHVPVVGDAVAAFMAGPGTSPAAMRAVDSVAQLPADPAAAAEQVLRFREELGCSYVVLGADVAEPLYAMVADLAGR